MKFSTNIYHLDIKIYLSFIKLKKNVKSYYLERKVGEVKKIIP